MGNFSKSGTGTVHGNTVVIQKIKIYFQVFPGVAGSDAQRGIPGVPFEVEMIDSSGIGLKSAGKTGKDGMIDLNIPVGEKAILTIFDTEYLITVRNTIPDVKSYTGLQRRLSALGYYLGNIDGVEVYETTASILNFQADSNLNADEERNTLTLNQLKNDFGE